MTSLLENFINSANPATSLSLNHTEGYDFITCPVCYKRVKEINTSHAKSHGFSRPKDLAAKYNLESTKCQMLRDRFKGSNNPGYQHGGKFSPFSKNFIKGDISDEIKARANQTRIDNNSFTTTIEYWLKQGLSETEARQKLSERQSTFSLEKCIEKYGVDEGTRRWKERQDKWQTTLKSKPQEEIDRINKSKSFICKRDINAGWQNYYLDQPDKKAIFYLFEYRPKGFDETFLKFGITKRKLYDRWKSTYIMQVFGIWEGTCPEIFSLEQTIKRYVHTNNLITESHGFEGHTECVHLDSLNTLISLIPSTLKRIK